MIWNKVTIWFAYKRMEWKRRCEEIKKE